MKRSIVLIIILCMTAVFLFPIFQGFIILPLDLLVANHNPWYYQSAILVKNSFMEDSISQMYPWRFFVFESLRHGIIPFWNPYTLMGTPFLASMKPMVFYPFTLLLFPLGPYYGWNTLLFLQIALSLFFTYLFLREWKLSSLISLFGSMVFALNTLMIGVLEFGSEGQVLLWFPLIFFAVKKIIDKKNNWFLPLIGFPFAFSILAGQMQYLLYMAFGLLIFILAYGITKRITIIDYLFIFLALLLGIGVASIQLVPSFELLSLANRSLQNSQMQFSQSLLDFVQLLRLLAPDFFGNPVTKDYTLNYIEGGGYFGIVPLFFVVFAGIFFWKRKLVRYCLAMILVGILFSTKLFGSLLLLSNLQVITYGAGYRIFSLVYLPAAILAGLGLTQFIKVSNKRIWVYTTLFILCCFAIFGFVYITKPPEIHFKNLLFPLFILIVFSFGLTGFFVLRKKIKIAPTIFILFVLFITFFDLFRTGYRFLTFSNMRFFYPSSDVTAYIQDKTHSSLYRTEGLTDSEIGTMFFVSSPEIYNPLYLKRSRIFMDTLIGHETTDPQSAARYLLTLKTGKDLKRAVDFLGVGYIVTGTDHNPSIDYYQTNIYEPVLNPYVKRFERQDVFKNKNVYSRFGVFYSIIPVSSDEKALEKIADKKIDLRKQIILTNPSFIPDSMGKGSANVLSYGINSASFAVDSTQKGYFYLSDTMYPGWKAMVNGKEQKIVLANYNFRAVVIPAGKSVVTFSYLPTHFYLGLVITIISTLLLFLIPLINLPIFFSKIIKKVLRVE